MTGFPASLSARVIYLNSPIDEDSARLVMESLLFFDIHEPGAPMTLVIDSPGGQVYAGLAIYDVMRRTQSPLVTLGVNVVGGLATLLLAAGNPGGRYLLLRSAVATSVVMSPPSKWGFIQSREVNRLRGAVAACYAAATSNANPDQFVGEEKVLSPEDAIRLGLADRILEAKTPDYFGYLGGLDA